MFTGGESPGSIRNQVGRSLNEVRDCVSRGDALQLADHFRLLVALASPHLDDVSRGKLRIKSGLEDEGAIFQACMDGLEVLLPILAEKGLYAYVNQEVGDASGLALADEDDDPSDAVKS